MLFFSYLQKDGMTPLLKACQRRNYTMQRILLSYGANAKHKDKVRQPNSSSNQNHKNKVRQPNSNHNPEHKDKVRQPHSNHNPEHRDKVGQPD